MFHKPVISQSKPIINQLTVTLNEENIPNTMSFHCNEKKKQKQLIILKGNRRDYKLKLGRYLQHQKC